MPYMLRKCPKTLQECPSFMMHILILILIIIITIIIIIIIIIVIVIIIIFLNMVSTTAHESLFVEILDHVFLLYGLYLWCRCRSNLLD